MLQDRFSKLEMNHPFVAQFRVDYETWLQRRMKNRIPRRLNSFMIF